MDVRQKLDEIRVSLGVSTDEELSVLLKTSKANVDSWVKRKSIPEKWLLKIGQMHQSPTSLHVNTITATKLSPKMDELVRWFSVLDKDDQKRIYNEIKALADKKLDLSHL